MSFASFLKTLALQTGIILSIFIFQTAHQPASQQSEPKTGSIIQSTASDKPETDPRVVELLEAIRNENGRRVDELLKDGVKVDGETRTGETAMGYAVTRSDRAMVKRLLKAGADINHGNKVGVTPLMMAALYGDRGITAFLLEKGADVNARAKDGQTPLMAAAMQGKPDIIKLLLEKGAKVNDEDEDRYTALTYALRAGHREAAEVIREAGGTAPPPDLKANMKSSTSADSSPPAGGNVSTIDRKPKLLNVPKPQYTEEARRNQVQGIVIARVLVGVDGQVKQVRITRGLPDGLDEQALAAAYRLRFEPAMKDGKPVQFWQSVQIEFNLKH